MRTFLLVAASVALVLPALPADSRPLHHHHRHARQAETYPGEVLPYSTRPSDYSNGNGTNAGNSTAVTPITPYGGYVVNEQGFGNYIGGPAGYGGYPAGSPGAQIWRQREEWKCEAAPESC